MRFPMAILAIFILAGCAWFAPDPAPVAITCVKVKTWSRADQNAIAEQYAALPADSLLRPVVREWIGLHKQAESCK